MKAKHKDRPQFFYAMSIAATWAGAGSFIVGTQIAKEYGIFPWLLWALGNTLTCIIFGIISQRFHTLRQVAKSKPVQWLMGFMCIFQIWVNMSGIYDTLSATVLGSTVSYIIVYAVTAFFIAIYMKNATYRNVMTDNFSWLAVYAMIALLVIFSFIQNGVTPIPAVIDPVQIKSKLWLCITLAFGAFFYPTFWELLDYNESNTDGVTEINMDKPFVMGGLLFGFYLLFVLAGAFTTYSVAVDLIKGILISLIAVSSLSSFLHGAVVNFGKRIGFVVDITAVLLWKILVPMGIMGIWTLMQNVRIWMVFGMFAIAIGVYIGEKYEEEWKRKRYIHKEYRR